MGQGRSVLGETSCTMVKESTRRERVGGRVTFSFCSFLFFSFRQQQRVFGFLGRAGESIVGISDLRSCWEKTSKGSDPSE